MPSITDSLLYAPDVRVVRAVFSPAEIQGLTTSGFPNNPTGAYLLIPYPGIGKANIPLDSEANFQFLSTPYATGTGNLILIAFGAPTITVMQNLSMKQSHSWLERTNFAGFNGDARNGLSYNNTAWFLSISNSVQFTAGDSSLVLVVRYRTIEIGNALT